MGAYAGNALHDDNHDEVWAPRFHGCGVDGDRAWRPDRSGNMVETLLGGWNAPTA